MAEKLEQRIEQAFSAPVAPADPAGLQRILARRARGERIALEAGRRAAPWVYRTITGAIAAGLLLFVSISVRENAAPRQASSSEPLTEASLLPQMLMAQGAERPSYPVLAMDGLELKPGEWAYALLERGTQYTDSSRIARSRLKLDVYNGKPAWLLLSRPAKGAEPVEWQDTSWVDDASLKLLARSTSVMNGEGRVTEEFRANDILKGFSKGGYTTWSVLVTDSTKRDDSNGYVLQGDVLFMALRRTRLSADWHASIELMSLGGASRVPSKWYDLAVVGEERVKVPAGEFDCWKIRFGPPSEYRYLGGIWIYVSKDRQWMIKQGIEGGRQPEFWSVLVSGRED